VIHKFNIYNEDNDYKLRTKWLPHWVRNPLCRKTIGRGTFGKVKKAIHKVTGEPVAIKIL
jgi:hypothetical protein